jgi:hypothetical protein
MPLSSVIEAMNECRELLVAAREEGIDFHVCRARIEEAFVDLGSPQMQAVSAILSERERQDQQWGGSAHDDQHHVEDWITYISQQIEKFTDGPGPEVSCESANEWNFDNQRLIAIGALAVAALESRIRLKLASDQQQALAHATATLGREGVAVQ